MDSAAIEAVYKELAGDAQGPEISTLTPLGLDLVRVALAMEHQRRTAYPDRMRGEMLTVDQTRLKHYLEQRTVDMQAMATAFESGEARDAFWLQYDGQPAVRRRLPVFQGDATADAARMGGRLAETEGLVVSMEDNVAYALRHPLPPEDHAHRVDWMGRADLGRRAFLVKRLEELDRARMRTVFDPVYPAEARAQVWRASGCKPTLAVPPVLLYDWY